MRLKMTRQASELILRGAERFRFTSWGVAGGGPGQAYRLIVNEGRANERRMGKLDRISLDAGETLTVCMPGAAGFGDPLERPLDDVRRDLLLGFVSTQGAEEFYGIVFDPAGEIDEAATTRRRSANKTAPSRFGFGAHRLAWESVFDDSIMTALTQVLHVFPKSRRPRLKEAFFDTVLECSPLEAIVPQMPDHSVEMRARAHGELNRLIHMAQSLREK